jgi:hypothetical protein
MTRDENNIVVVVEEDVALSGTTASPTASAPSAGSSWTALWIISALVGILSVVLFWLPSPILLQFSLPLTAVQRQNKLWGLYSNDTIAPVGGDFCQRVPGIHSALRADSRTPVLQ